jgi:hypothetical protein
MRRARIGSGLLVGVLAGGPLACYPVYRTPGAEGMTESGGGSSTGTSSGATGGAAVTTGVVAPVTTTDESGGTGNSGDGSSTAEGTSGSTGGQTFIVETDMGYAPWCDNFAQDCPSGYKCSAYAEGGGNSWNALKCVPVMEGAVGVGEACFVEGNGVSGIDNCELGAYCWETDAENKGVCVGLCSGSPEAPVCPPKSICAIWGSGILNLCLGTCDPLTLDCVQSGDVCISTGDTFICVLDASGEEAQAHDPCEYANSCDPGLACVNSTAAVECDPAVSGCCEPFCDLSEPNLCPGQGQVCTPWFEQGQAPEGYEKVGVCALP